MMMTTTMETRTMTGVMMTRGEADGTDSICIVP